MNEKNKNEKPVRDGNGKRKKSVPVFLLILIAAAAVGVLLGFLIGKAIKSFRDEGMKEFVFNELTVSLPGSFKEEKREAEDAVSYSGDLIEVHAAEIPFDGAIDKMSVVEFRKNQNAEAEPEAKEINYEGLTADEGFYRDEKGERYRLRCYFKSDGAFYTVSFCCAQDRADELFETMIGYAKTVEIAARRSSEKD